MIRIRNWVFLAGLLSAASPASAQRFENISSIELQSIEGKPAFIAPDVDFTVLLFLGTDCPISQKYMHRITELQKRFGDKVDFYAIMPKESTLGEINAFREEYKSSLLFLRDPEKKMIAYLGASVTPEVFLFNTNYELKYKGAVDNWFYELGKYRRVTSEHYLIDALNAVLIGNNPAIRETKAVGCIIQQPMNGNHHDH